MAKVVLDPPVENDLVSLFYGTKRFFLRLESFRFACPLPTWENARHLPHCHAWAGCCLGWVLHVLPEIARVVCLVRVRGQDIEWDFLLMSSRRKPHYIVASVY